GGEAAYFRVGPFTTDDGRGFVAIPGELTSFTTAEGITVDVPAAAFAEATTVTVSTLDPCGVAVPTPAGVQLGAYVSVDFEGEASETLRLSLPAPAGAAVGARVVVAEPTDLPWGRKLKLLSIGGVVERNGQKWMANDPATQPEPSSTPTPAQAAGAGGNGTVLAGGGIAGGQTCAQARQQGLPRCFFQSVFMEFQAKANAAWFVEEVGAELALLTGTVSPSFASPFAAVYDSLADTWVYLPTPHNWNGHYVLPVRANQPLNVVQRDLATGWVLSEEAYEPVPVTVGVLVDKGELERRESTPLMLVDAQPFSLVRFRTPPAEQTQSLRLEVEADADNAGRVTVSSVDAFPLAKGSQVEVLDLAPIFSQPAGVAKPLAQFGPVCDQEWSTTPFKGSDDLLLVVSPGSLDAADLETIELQFDRPLDDLSAVDPATVAVLEDLGEGDGCTASPTGPKSKVPLRIEQNASRSRLILRLPGILPAGHSFRLELKASGIRSGSKTYPQAPNVFTFTTRSVPGTPVGSQPDDKPSLGDTSEARDLLKIGNLAFVASATGRLLAVDTSEHKAGGFALHAIANGVGSAIRALATDGHGRVFYNLLEGSTWAIKAVRIEDARQRSAPCQGQPGWASELECFEPVTGGVRTAYGVGSGPDLTGSEWLAQQTLPSGTPVDLEVLAQDESGKKLELSEFVQTYLPHALNDYIPDAHGTYTLEIPLKSSYQRANEGATEPSQPDAPIPAADSFKRSSPCGGEPAIDRFQRVSIYNLATGQTWSMDLENEEGREGAGAGSLTVRARRGERLQVRYNLTTLGYVALLGSGVTVVDLNRFYRLPTPAGSKLSQCGRRLGSYQGQEFTYPACAYLGGVPDTTAVAGLDIISSLAVQATTGLGDKDGPRGAGSIDAYVPRVHIGAVHAASSRTQPGELKAKVDDQGVLTEIGTCLKKLTLTRTEGGPVERTVRLRDVALANDATWLDRGIVGGLDGTFQPPPKDHKPVERQGDLLFLSLGDAGVLVFDVSARVLDGAAVRGWLHVDGHSINRLQVDGTFLLAGGLDATGAPVIDLWEIAAINGSPNKLSPFVPRPIATVKAPWGTNSISLDHTGLGMLYTWGGPTGTLAIPLRGAEFVFAGLYRLPEKEDTAPAETRPRPSVSKLTSAFVPLGVPMERTPANEAKLERVKENERSGSAAFKVRVALPGHLGETLTAKVQSLRALPPEHLLGKDDVAAAVAMPGGPDCGWPKRDVYVTLRRRGHTDLGGDGKLAQTYNLYESDETVILVADPRARHGYTRQDLTTGPAADEADEKSQCRRCEWPSVLDDPTSLDETTFNERYRELLAGGPYVRAILAVDPESSAEQKDATDEAIAYFEDQGPGYPLPAGVARLVAWADDVPSPIQASLAEPVLNPAIWSPGEAGAAVSLVAGEALLSATDFAWQGRVLGVALDRSYRSGTLGYGPLGAAGWHSSLFAHLREIPTTGEVEYHDGSGNVYRFYPGTEDPPSDHYEKDAQGQYSVPKGLYLRLVKLDEGQGWRLLDRHHNEMVFDPAGRLTEINDRLRQGKPLGTQGNTLRFRHDAFGQLTGIEDDLGRNYTLEYEDDPRTTEENHEGKKYGLLKKVTDFVPGTPRTVLYDFGTDRLLKKVMLPAVSNPVAEYSQYSFTGLDDFTSPGNRPLVEYRYNPLVNVSSSESSTTAVLHGELAKLRLEGFEVPGSDVLRVRFEYDSTTGRLATLGVPTPHDQNLPGSSVAWALSFPEQTGSAAPASRVIVEQPWGNRLEYDITPSGRTKRLIAKGIETLRANEPTPGPGGGGTAQDLETTVTYLHEGSDEEDGRIEKVVRPDKGVIEYEHKGKDRLALANESKVTVSAGENNKGTADYDDASTFQAYAVTDEAGHVIDEASADNFPGSITDALGRRILHPPAQASSSLPQIPAGHPDTAEQVVAFARFDKYGRTTSLVSKQRGQEPTVTQTLTFVTPPGRPAGSGRLSEASIGMPGNPLTVSLFYDPLAGNVALQRTAPGDNFFTSDEWDRTISEIRGASAGTFRGVSAQVKRAFDVAGRLVVERRSQQGLGDVETRYEYNRRDQVTKITETSIAGQAPGSVSVDPVHTELTYDDSGRLETIKTPGGIVTTFTRDAAGRVATSQTGDAAPRRVLYDELGRQVYTTDGHQGSWRSYYDAWGKPYREDLPTGAVVRRQFDKAGGLMRETVLAMLAGFDQAAFDNPDGSPLRLSDATYTYGSDGRLRSTSQVTRLGTDGAPDERLTRELQYSTAGRLDFVQTRINASTTRFELQREYMSDSSGRLLLEKDAANNTTRYSYYPGTTLPSEVRFEEAGGAGWLTLTSSRRYDGLGRLVGAEQGGTTTDLTLDEAGHTLSATVAGLTWSYSYDSRGTLRTASGPGGRQASFGYDPDGRLLAQLETRAAGLETTTFGYTKDRLTTITHPDASTEHFAYEVDGAITSHTTRLGLVLSVGVDAANRPTTVVPGYTGALPIGLAPLGTGDRVNYDALSRLIKKGVIQGNDIDPTRCITFAARDARGLPASEQVGTWDGGPPINLTRTYDLYGDTASLTLSAGLGPTFGTLSLAHDALHRLTRVPDATDQGSVPIGFGAAYDWRGAARLTRASSLGGLDLPEVYEHEDFTGLLKGLDYKRSETLSLGGFDYLWDASHHFKQGRLATAGPSPASLVARQGTAWDKDGLNRLQSASLGGGERQVPVGSWGFDYGLGDELSRIVETSLDPVMLTPGPGGRPLFRQTLQGTTPFIYDLEGKRIEDDRFTFTWDWRGNLVQVDIHPGVGLHDAAGQPLDGHRVTYTYDPLGRVLTRTHESPAHGATAEAYIDGRAFIWDGDRLAAEAGLNFNRG
ncbi:MAG TPA: DUF6531 domain-containing protein, partial [Thermoanaerobaculaceae bacterium]|nr:DUF6531 domain-containing protein [Thermoanaerobaculaceae bacterium]